MTCAIHGTALWFVLRLYGFCPNQSCGGNRRRSAADLGEEKAGVEEGDGSREEQAG